MALSGHQFAGLATDMRTKGGFTVDVNTGNQPTSGIAVAMPGAEATYPQAGAGDIEAYSRKYSHLLNKPGAHLGGWAAGPAEETPGDAEAIAQTTAKYAPESRNGPRAEVLHDVDVLDVSKVIPEHPRGHHIADVYREMHVNRQDAAFDLGSYKTSVNPRAPYPTRAVGNDWSEADEHGSQMRLRRR